ncbi:MAG: glycine zipper 2TM domain-containing protein [Wenzhouxiangellaceae bacterium]|nr:glycine zipper 2TM domain-containing protein [Wenzhouxiangellaceae bacterium]
MFPAKLFPRILLIGSAAALSACAAHASHPPVHEVWAPVVGVEPVYVTERVPVEREVCWQERRRGHRHDSATGTIAGAIIGGVIGNQFGGGSGKKALTAAGAVLGASIGHDATRHDRHRSHPVRRCEIQVDYETRSFIEGYIVEYEYEGEIFETRRRHPPGDRIRLEISARPVG